MVIRTFHFHGSQLGRAMSDFNAAGFVVHGVQPIGNGIYEVVVSLPAQIGTVDWATMDSWQQRRRRRWRFPGWRRLAMIAAVLLILIGGGYLLYAAVAGGPSNAQAAAQPGFLGFQLPELPSNAPDELLADALAGPIADITRTVKTIIGAIIVVGSVALLWFLRGPLTAIGSGLAGLGRMFGRGK